MVCPSPSIASKVLRPSSTDLPSRSASEATSATSSTWVCSTCPVPAGGVKGCTQETPAKEGEKEEEAEPPAAAAAPAQQEGDPSPTLNKL